MRDTITLFMWGYQPHFRAAIQIRANWMMERLGIAGVEPRVALVGVRKPGGLSPHPICIEPEDGDWPLAMFDGLMDEVEPAIINHPDQRMFYGDERAMREKPERIRRRVVTELVRRRFERSDQELGLRSFCSMATLIDDYYVVTVIQLPLPLFERWPSVTVPYDDEPHELNFLVESIRQLLGEAERALLLPEPGRGSMDEALRSASEMIERAAEMFMRWQFIENRPYMSDLFNRANAMSQLQYERRIGTGKLILAPAEDPNIDYQLRFAQAVPLSQTRWIRKLLEMAEDGSALIANGEAALGVGKLVDAGKPYFWIEFLGSHQWEFKYGGQTLLRCHFGQARLPQEAIDGERFADNLRRALPGIEGVAIAAFKAALDQMLTLPRGSMLVIAEDAADESKRLDRQGTLIEPTPLTAELLQVGLSIDGSMLSDLSGICHAVGVILDGEASDESTPSRGSRFNSAVRYVLRDGARRMAFVVSDDRTLDIIPLLRPRVSRRAIQLAVEEISQATRDTYHKARSFLDDHRFYLSAGQCQLVNDALDRIDAEPVEVGRILLRTARFQPDPEMDDGYLIDD